MSTAERLKKNNRKKMKCPEVRDALFMINKTGMGYKCWQTRKALYSVDSHTMWKELHYLPPVQFTKPSMAMQCLTEVVTVQSFKDLA